MSVREKRNLIKDIINSYNATSCLSIIDPEAPEHYKSNGRTWTVLGPVDKPTPRKYDVVLSDGNLDKLPEQNLAMTVSLYRTYGEILILTLPMGESTGEGKTDARSNDVREKWSLVDVKEVLGDFVDHVIHGDRGIFVFKAHKEPLKIAVYCIAKNEAKFVARCMESALDADYFILADTGSDDDTIRIAKDRGGIIHNISVSPWRFDDARNAALACVPVDVDVCISLDLDEVLVPGWRRAIEDMWSKGRTTRMRCMFDFGGGVIYPYQKIHQRHGYRWKHPCHEYLEPDLRLTEHLVTTGEVLIKHLPDHDKSRSQYLGMLEVAVKEAPESSHHRIYLGREYLTEDRPHEAIEHLDKYLTLPTSSWNKERAYAHILLAKCYESTNDSVHRLEHLRRAVAEAPEMRETHCELARYYYDVKHWPECLAAAIAALRITTREYYYMVYTPVWEGIPEDLAAVASHHIGLTSNAIRYGGEALKLSPHHRRFQKNMAVFKAARESVNEQRSNNE